MRLKRAGVDGDLELPHKAADCRDLCDALRLRDRKSYVPVLQCTQVGQSCACSLDNVLKHPSHTRRIRTERRRHATRQAARSGVEILQDAAARPVDVGPFIEDNVDERYAEIRKAADHARARHREQCRRKWERDLVFDDLRRLPGIVGIDDYLCVREIGQRVQIETRERVAAGSGGRKRNEHG